MEEQPSRLEIQPSLSVRMKLSTSRKKCNVYVQSEHPELNIWQNRQNMLWLLMSFNWELGFFFFLFFFFLLFRATPAAYGSFQVRDGIGAAAAGLRHSHSSMGSKPHLPPTPQLRATGGALIHWARPGIKPTSLWILVGSVTTEPRCELPDSSFIQTFKTVKTKTKNKV